jgi:ABC-type glycerol-3-phosphate transport system permease component
MAATTARSRSGYQAPSIWERTGRLMGDNLIWLSLLLLLVWVVIPMFWSIMSTFKTPIEVYRTPPSIFPDRLLLDSYRRVLTYPGFARFFVNTLYLAVTSTLLTVVISTWAAYAMARYAFPLRNLLLVLILVPRIIPRISLVIPLYGLVVRLGLLDTYTALIITYTATAIPFATWIMTGFFQTIPKDIEDAARIDGASLWQIMWRVMIPMALPGIITVGVFSVREAWNEFPFALSFTTSAEMRTLTYQLYLMRDTMGLEDWPLLNAFAILTILPILIVYLRFEKRVVSGLISGAVK